MEPVSACNMQCSSAHSSACHMFKVRAVAACLMDLPFVHCTHEHPQVKAKLREAEQLSQHMIKYDEDSFGKIGSSSGTRKTSFWRQFWTLTKRDAILAVRDPTL
jgi:hypothetical protein